MCRWLVYKGPQILLSELLIVPEHSIIKQSSAATYRPGLETSPFYRACDVGKRNHSVNADGFGIGWYNMAVCPQPCIFTSVSPAWSNRNLVRMSHVVLSNLVFAHVRAASPGSVVNEQNCHPFRNGRYMFMHNGDIPGFAKMKRLFREDLSDDCYNMIEGNTDSEHVFALLVNSLGDCNKVVNPDSLASILVGTIDKIVKIMYRSGCCKCAASLNFAVTDGETVVATRFRSHVDEDPPSLYYRIRDAVTSRHENDPTSPRAENNTMTLGDETFNLQKGSGTMCAISSEPLTKEVNLWSLVPKDHMIIVYPDCRVSMVPLQFTPPNLSTPAPAANGAPWPADSDAVDSLAGGLKDMSVGPDADRKWPGGAPSVVAHFDKAIVLSGHKK